MKERQILLTVSLAAVSAISPACSSSVNMLPPTPMPYEIPTVNPFDQSNLREISRFYPYLLQLSSNLIEESLDLQIPTHIYNFTANRQIDSHEATKVFTYYDMYVNQNVSFPYTFLQTVDAILYVTKRPIIERNIIIVPDNGPSLPATTSETAVTLYDENDQGEVKTYTFIMVQDSPNPKQDLEQTDFRKFVVEACQSTVLIVAQSDQTTHIKALENLGQEVYCNSLSYALEDRFNGLQYQAYADKNKDMYLFGANPVIVSIESNYNQLPQFGQIIK